MKIIVNLPERKFYYIVAYYKEDGIHVGYAQEPTWSKHLVACPLGIASTEQIQTKKRELYHLLKMRGITRENHLFSTKDAKSIALTILDFCSESIAKLYRLKPKMREVMNASNFATFELSLTLPNFYRNQINSLS